MSGWTDEELRWPLTVKAFQEWGDGPVPCPVCGDDIYDGDPFVEMPATEITTTKAVYSTHPHCAVRDGFSVLQSGARGGVQ